MNFIEELFSEEELSLYKATEYPFNLSILHTALKVRLKKEPDYEVFVPLIYYAYEQHRRSSNWPSLITPYKVFISNKGNVYSLKKSEPKLLNILGDEDGYRTVSVGVDKRGRSLMLHRAMACSFLSLDKFLLSNEDIFAAHPKDLQVNHIDGVKSNFEFDNLEWVTHSGNQQHAVDVGLKPIGVEHVQTKAVKGIVAFGIHRGYSFVLHGASDYKQHGFGQPNIVACLKGRKNSHKNCTWTYATDEEILTLPRGVTEEVKTTITGKSQRVA